MTAMHASTVRRFLGGGPDAVKEYEKQRAGVTDALLVAGKNITYKGEEEKVRILLNALSRYEAAITTAVTLSARADPDPGSGFAGLVARARNRAEVIQKVREADGILKDHLSPATVKLDEINTEQLTKDYGGHSDAGRGWETGVVAIGIVLGAALVRIQIYLRRQFRRTCNPFVALATVLAVAFVLFSVYQLNTSRAELRLAKEDAFTSIHTLREARADGYTALAAAQLRLLDPEKAAEYKERFDKATTEVAKPDGLSFKQLVDDTRKLNLKQSAGKAKLKEFKGHLYKELRNVTFDGEQDAALAAVTSFGEFVGDPPSPTGPGPDSATLTTRFARFDADLDKVIAINEDAFEREINRGEKVLDRCGALNLWAMLGVVVLTAVGLYPRLRESAV
jgi:hypothetical protein